MKSLIIIKMNNFALKNELIKKKLKEIFSIWIII